MEILDRCTEILDARNVASHDRGTDFFKASSPGKELCFLRLLKN